MIKRETIQAVYQAANVVDVIQDFVQLKRIGANYKTLSPFTNEKTPSFVVSPQKNIWKCFSTNKGGDAIKFLQEYERLSWPDAIKYVAKKYNITIQYEKSSQEEKEKADKREQLFHALDFYKSLFVKNLWNPHMNAIPMNYLRSRGFDDQTIKAFGLGYARQSRQDQYNQAIKSGIKDEILKELGLVFITDIGQTIDRFRDRIIFPVFSLSGRTTGFGGRVIESKGSIAKYLNSSESEVYQKSKLLYGLFQARQEIRMKDACHIVEGYTDVIKMYQKGIKNVVASAGTALTKEQVRLIGNNTKNIILLFDSDAAGQSAALRSINLILEQGLNVKVCALPKGEDPDSFSTKNTLEDIQEYLEAQSEDFIEFKANQLGIAESDNPTEKAEVINQIIASIAVIPNLIEREFYIKKAAKSFQLDERNLFDAMAQEISKKQRFESRKFTSPILKTVEPTPQKHKEVKTQQSDQLKKSLEELLEDLVLYATREITIDETTKSTENFQYTLTKRKVKVFEKIESLFQEENLFYESEVDQKLFELLIHQCKTQGTLDEQFFSMIGSKNPDFTTRVSHFTMKYEAYPLSQWENQNIAVPTIDQGAEEKINDDLLNLEKLLVEQKIESLEEKFKQLDKKGVFQSKEGNELLRQIVEYNDMKSLISERLERIV
ncbi:MAG: DNA primase [Flavobacteriaceae bacterium]|nr:DNA primase [Flavobacteriaceae bacterium]MCY4267416.1 DNA primase [Flavobacteriaceae bacterium]